MKLKVMKPSAERIISGTYKQTGNWKYKVVYFYIPCYDFGIVTIIYGFSICSNDLLSIIFKKSFHIYKVALC